MPLLERLFPATCAACRQPDPHGFCAACLATLEPAPAALLAPRGVDHLVCPWLYGGQLAVAIEHFKYQRFLPAVGGLAALIAEPLALALRRWAPQAVVPVPMPRARVLFRGMVHAALLAEHALAPPHSALLAPRLLQRRTTRWWQLGLRPQARLTRHERLTNVEGTFRAAPATAALSLALFDDVVTTGATLSACATACRAAGARAVFAFAMAYKA